jgi:Family of unknown function (DUF6459)
MLSLSSPQESPSTANVIKWTEALPGSRNTTAAPAPLRTEAAMRTRRRQRRAPGLPLPPWPSPGAQPSCPLPDPALARLCAVPDPAPPYDEDLDEVWQCAHAVEHAAVSPDGPARPHPAAHPAGNPDGPARPDAVEHADRGRDGGAAQGTDDRPSSLRRPGGGQPTRPAPTWPSQFAQVLAETLAGSRPPGQLTPWTTERARGHIRRLGPLLAASHEPRIRRIVASTPSSGVVEMAVVVRFGPRIRALAIRLERANTSHVRAWQCTAIEAA